MFKKMAVQKRRELMKAWEKQEKRLREMKAAGQSKKKAESKQKEILTRKQEKNRTKNQKQDEEQGPTELLEKPREYIVKFRFPETSELQPPILGMYNLSFRYEGQPFLFKDVDFGIDMQSRIAIVGELRELHQILPLSNTGIVEGFCYDRSQWCWKVDFSEALDG